MSQSRVYLAAVGDCNSPVTWSGIPYHFLQAAQAGKLIDAGLALKCDNAQWKRQRLLWNGWRWMTARGKGGYQYSVPFLERLWQVDQPRLLDQITINCFQLFPPSMVKEPRYRKIFYIDMTLHQLFEDYQIRQFIGSSIAREALEREQLGYQAADLVVGHSQWAARSVIEDYGISPDKVSAIVPGANIDRSVYQQWHAQASQPASTAEEPLKLIFVGKYWDRKGLDRLLEALLLVHREHRRVHLKVIGCRREDLPEHLQNVPDVEWLGFIDKRKEMSRFLDIVSRADIGCLLSRAEAGGMVLREYHALGLPVMGTAVGGSPEHMFDNAGHAFAPTADATEIASWLIGLIDHPESLQRLRQRAWERRLEATWDATVRQWHTLLSKHYVR